MEDKKDLSAEDEKALHEAIKDWKKKPPAAAPGEPDGLTDAGHQRKSG